MAIYVAAHKAYNIIPIDGYIPLQVGAAQNDPLPYEKDETGESISEKNPHYCELTGLYWIWKNRREDYKGLVHYRRYFVKGGRLLTQEDIRTLLADSDVILPPAEILRENAWEEFCLHSGHEHDLVLLRDAVATVDKQYLPSFDAVMQGNRLRLYNMMIAKEPLFDAYCQWLFAVLFELEQHVDMTNYTPYQQRLYGFLGERLLNVWMAHNKPRIAVAHVKNTEQPLGQTLRIFLRRQKNRLLFNLKKRS